MPTAIFLYPNRRIRASSVPDRGAQYITISKLSWGYILANKIIFRRWREEWQSTASRTGIIRVPSTVLPKTQVPTTRSPGPGLYNVRGSVPRYVPLILCGLGGIPVGPEIAQRRLPDELRNFSVGSGGPEGSVSEFHRQPSPSDFRPRGSPPRHRRIHGTQRGHRPPYFKTKSCADTRPIQDRYTSCAKTLDRTSGPIRELPLGSCPTKMGRARGSSLVGATKQHFRIGPIPLDRRFRGVKFVCITMDTPRIWVMRRWPTCCSRRSDRWGRHQNVLCAPTRGSPGFELGCKVCS